MLGLISSIIGMGGEWVRGKQKITAAKAERTAELIKSKTDNDAAWESQQINAKDRWLRRGCFLMFAMPFVWAAFDAQGVNDYFTIALASVPQWYQTAFLSMVGSIWGVATLKNIFNK